MSDAPPPTLSVVVVTRNEAENVEACLASVMDLCESGPDYEIVLVDSNSSDGTVDLAADYPATVLRIPSDDLSSPGAGRYVGTAHAEGDYILFVDGDMQLTTGWLDDALELVRRPRVAGVSGALDHTRNTRTDADDPDERAPGKRDSADATRESDDSSRGDPVYVPDGATAAVPDSAPQIPSPSVPRTPDGSSSTAARPVDALRGVALYDAAALAAVGGFDPHLLASEDTDVGYRLWAAGYELHRLPVVVARHTHSVSLTEPLRRWRRGYFQGVGQAVRKGADDPAVLARHLVGLRHPLIAGAWGVLAIALAARSRRALAVWTVLTVVGLGGYTARSGPKQTALDIASYGCTLLGLVIGGASPPPDPETYPLDRVEVVQSPTNDRSDPA